MNREIRIGLIGYQFMGRAHANAYQQAARFFDPKARSVMKAVCGRHQDGVEAFARRWGFESCETDWRRLVERKDIDLVDITTPNNLHAEAAVAAAEAGKAVFCEKPLALNLEQAETMLRAVSGNRVFNAVCFNYRRAPALALMKKLIAEGRLGRIYHLRGIYLQDWLLDPEFPLAWRMKKEVAGSGSLGDLASHQIDAARWLLGEFSEVCGRLQTFVKERPVATSEGNLAAVGGSKRGRVTVDDAVLFLARFRNGALGSFEATRFAAGHKNQNRLEVNGEKGSLIFNLERLNELEYYNTDDPEEARGFRLIQVTEPVHPYLSAWWPPGHIIGYEHTFIHTVLDVINAWAAGAPFQPDFKDGLACQRVLAAVSASAASGAWVKLAAPAGTGRRPAPKAEKEEGPKLFNA
ncbi:MAG TPA: Gfo/Idh/MocA family oxidoreductase [bacterium]|uniref:1,5-anhydro-D-fructose reductase n=1 Tax=candidate division TA06 bacterium ADurb.Bin417 TaxID=1852828 RepID=A0A1V5MG24_UNCT6|nr:MAG: 1,5-anhydro-D-fructose reductase [candidate division TA06 bacterium ADurb.Bin417]HNQ35645.1 Gfo/Idh/MocA family oxidoreductase [bacterium]HNS48324.1 Gfo/Idh/MocA family oxidoreductase [bacterium]